QRWQIKTRVFVEVTVLDGEDGLREGEWHILRRELIALKDTPGGEDLPAIRLHHECARCRFDHQPSVRWNSRNAISDVSEHKEDNGPERCGDRVRTQQGVTRHAPPALAR